MAADIIDFKPIERKPVDWNETNVIVCGECHHSKMTLMCHRSDENVYMVCNKCGHKEVI